MENGEMHVLVFPCRRNLDGWVNAQSQCRVLMCVHALATLEILPGLNQLTVQCCPSTYRNSLIFANSPFSEISRRPSNCKSAKRRPRRTLEGAPRRGPYATDPIEQSIPLKSAGSRIQKKGGFVRPRPSPCAYGHRKGAERNSCVSGEELGHGCLLRGCEHRPCGRLAR